MFRRQSDREFMREMILRMERSEREHRAALRDIREDLRAIGAELRDHRGEWHEAHREMIAEQRAGRQALLAVLDRLPPPGDATA